MGSAGRPKVGICVDPCSSVVLSDCGWRTPDSVPLLLAYFPTAYFPAPLLPSYFPTAYFLVPLLPSYFPTAYCPVPLLPSYCIFICGSGFLCVSAPCGLTAWRVGRDAVGCGLPGFLLVFFFVFFGLGGFFF